MGRAVRLTRAGRLLLLVLLLVLVLGLLLWRQLLVPGSLAPHPALQGRAVGPGVQAGGAGGLPRSATAAVPPQQPGGKAAALDTETSDTEKAEDAWKKTEEEKRENWGKKADTGQTDDTGETVDAEEAEDATDAEKAAEETAEETAEERGEAGEGEGAASTALRAGRRLPQGSLLSTTSSPAGDMQAHFRWVAWQQQEEEQEAVGSTGPGEGGVGVHLRGTLTPKERGLYKWGWANHSFNALLSDRISPNRSLPDVRPPQCRDVTYPPRLPDVSVIICFHNEAGSTLRRSVNSVLHRSPPALLRELILVDDSSDREELPPVVKELTSTFSKVKVIRLPERQGLIRARMVGAGNATGSVLVFLDSHIECTRGWLPPLVARVAQNWSHVVAPVIDVIDKETFRYVYSDTVFVGFFTWRLTFDWTLADPTPPSPTDPLLSPTMAGGLFAISRDYFFHMGQYDPEMDIWGGENLELSFRIWMCGGRLEVLPCSHVGHVFRSNMPYRFPRGSVTRNLARMAAVWMDGFSQRFFREHGKQLDYGDVRARRQLRERLHCRSFRWYLEQVCRQCFLPSKAMATGKLEVDGLPGMCVGRSSGGKVVAVLCQHPSQSSVLYLSREREVRRFRDEDQCLDAGGQEGSPLSFIRCHRQGGNQLWRYNAEQHRLVSTARKLCLAFRRQGREMVLEQCSRASNISQRFIWHDVVPDPLA